MSRRGRPSRHSPLRIIWFLSAAAPYNVAVPGPGGTTVRNMAGRWRFWTLALLWLPVGIAASALARFGMPADPAMESGDGIAAFMLQAATLAPVAPCGLPLALGCRRLRRLGLDRAAWCLGAVLGSATIAGALSAGLLGAAGVAVCAVILSFPAWALGWWFSRQK